MAELEPSSADWRRGGGRAERSDESGLLFSRSATCFLKRLRQGFPYDACRRSSGAGTAPSWRRRCCSRSSPAVVLRLRLDFDVLESCRRAGRLRRLQDLHRRVRTVDELRCSSVPRRRARARREPEGFATRSEATRGSGYYRRLQVRLDTSACSTASSADTCRTTPESGYRELENGVARGIEGRSRESRHPERAFDSQAPARCGTTHHLRASRPRSWRARPVGRVVDADGYFTAASGDALLSSRGPVGCVRTVFANRFLRRCAPPRRRARRVALRGDPRRVHGKLRLRGRGPTAIRWDVQRYTVLALLGVLASSTPATEPPHPSLRPYPLLSARSSPFPSITRVRKINAVSTSSRDPLRALDRHRPHFYTAWRGTPRADLVGAVAGRCGTLAARARRQRHSAMSSSSSASRRAGVTSSAS